MEFRVCQVLGAYSIVIACVAATGHAQADEPRVIPLDTVYSSACQKGLKRARRDIGPDLEETYRACQSGASNIVLVRADNFSAAVKATRLIFASGRTPTLGSVSGKETSEPSVWVVAYFGIDDLTEPPLWVVHSIEVKNQTVRVTFSKGKPFESADLVNHHFVWAPLGKLKAGSYTLELFDRDENEVSLLRRVKLPKKNNQ